MFPSKLKVYEGQNLIPHWSLDSSYIEPHDQIGHNLHVLDDDECFKLYCFDLSDVISTGREYKNNASSILLKNHYSLLGRQPSLLPPFLSLKFVESICPGILLGQNLPQ